MSIDDAFTMVFNAIAQRSIKWNDFHKVGIDEDYHDYYYAENELYIIHDRIFDSIEFVKAKSPKEALQKFDDVRRAVFSQPDEWE